MRGHIAFRAVISALIPALIAGQTAAQTALVPALTAPAADTGLRPTGSAHACGTRHYPASAVRSGEQGRTVVDVHVAADGTVKTVSVLESSGYVDLDAAALKCASKFVYMPATHEGVAVEAETVAAVNWCMSRACSEALSGLPLPKLPVAATKPAP